MNVYFMDSNQASVAINAVSLILAVGSVVSPIIFGFVLWKMSQIFVSKQEFNDFKQAVNLKDADTKGTMEKINDNMVELLQRTAHLRKE